eukprot:TRINITY_DN49_c0_g1_i1.p1 TRINITY_DN49_c0_g1~~TRINITY_DN49_c0_g1_i1.p1  ORF type:complete len:360 (-),score=93.27 TRINITY_DN49_c0_g1_i1:728-1807(-)
MSHEIVFENIHIVTSNDCYKLPQISMLDYCCIDLIKYHVSQYLSKEHNQDIAFINMRIATITANSQLQCINTGKLSELQRNADGGIFILVHSPYDSKSESNSSLLQFNLSVGEKSNQVTQLAVKYHQYNTNTIQEFITKQIKLSDDAKYDYYIDYNGHILSEKELKSEQRMVHCMHNVGGVNLLVLLRVLQENNAYYYDINNMDRFSAFEAKERYSDCSSLNGLDKFQKWWSTKKTKVSQNNTYGYHDIEVAINLKLVKISGSIQVVEAQEHILNVINNTLRSNEYKLITSNTRKLTDLTECLEEYEKEKILDETSYVYPCPHCNNGSNSRFVKSAKTNCLRSTNIFISFRSVWQRFKV